MYTSPSRGNKHKKSSIFVHLGWKDTEKRDTNTKLGTVLTKTPPYLIRNMFPFAGVLKSFPKNHQNRYIISSHH